MKKHLSKIPLLCLAFSLSQGSGYAFEPEIKLTGRKDLVLSVESRETVLRVGLTYLTKSSDEYFSAIEELSDPFAFESSSDPLVPIPENNTEVVVAEPETLDYDDATVLAAAASSFSKKVRGSMALGDSNYLQLEGGKLLKPGSAFQIRLPKADAFTVTVTAISTEGYTLKVGEETKTLTYENSPQSGSNSIQLTNP